MQQVIDWKSILCQEDILSPDISPRMRNLVRITLRRWKYPPDKQKEAIELVLRQAEVLSDHWSN